MSSRRNRVDVNNSIEDELRDDTCVVNENTENRKGGENNTSLPMNTINIQNGRICLNFNRNYFKFIDVPGEGDCFYHSVLE